MISSNYDVSPFQPQSATKAELDKVYALITQVKPESEPDKVLLSRNDWERSLNSRFADLIVQRWIVHSDVENNLVGYAELTIQVSSSANQGNVYTRGFIGVSVNHRRCGIGSTLLTTLLKYAYSKNISHIQIMTVAYPGHKFCQSFGGENVSEYLLYRGRIRDMNPTMLHEWTNSYNGPPIIFEITNKVPDKYQNEYNSLSIDIMNQRPIGQNEQGFNFTKENANSFSSARRPSNVRSIISIARNRDDGIIGISQRTYDDSNPEVITVEYSGVKSEYRNLGLGKYIGAKTLLYINDNLPDIEYEQTVVSKANTPNRTIRERLGYKLYGTKAIYKIPV